MIEIRDLTKTYGTKTAVDHLSVTIRPGVVTGLLGPNGAGKSTTMRVALGLDRPTSGQVLINGRRYGDHPVPLREVGALLEARAHHPGRSASHHLLALAATNGIGRGRVEEVIELVGLSDVARKRTKGFSLGMGQRIGIAAALLGDPGVIMLDEPVNGLDPEGIRWIRGLLRSMADEGRTVLVSSHVMSEMALTADHVVILGRGRLLADLPLTEMTAGSAAVRVRSPQVARLRELVLATGADTTVEPDTATVMTVTGMGSDQVAELAATHAIVLHELTPVHASLEEAYLSLTRDDVDYPSATTTRAPRRADA